MKKRLFIILTILTMMCCMPLAVSAAGGEHHVGTGDEFWNSWDAAIKDSGTVVLDRDVSIEWGGYVLEDSNKITIDLNGHCIKGVGKDAEYIFRVTDDAKLTITDNSKDASGYIQITNTSGKYKAVIGVDDDDAELILKKGTLKGNYDTKTRVVYVEDGKFTMNGGAVSDNVYNGWGSGVYIDEGSFVMTGGEICNNTANKQGDYNGCGGGVYYDGGSSTVFEMTGGEIHDNEAEDSGGGIYFDDGGMHTTFGSGKAVLSGGRIHHNYAKNGGGIFMDDTSDGVQLVGNLVIDYNSAIGKENGGGVYVHRQDAWTSSCTAILGGSVRIADNSSTDLFADPRYEAIEIIGTGDNKLNTSPDKHAWIGVSATEKYYPMSRDKYYYDYLFEEVDNARQYEVCFFGREAFNLNGQTVFVMDDEGDFVLTHTVNSGRGRVYLDQDKVIGRDGQHLVYGWVDGDYFCDTYDYENYKTHIESHKGLDFDRASEYLYSRLSDVKSITLQSVGGKEVQEEKLDNGKTRYTLYYLVQVQKTVDGKSYSQDYYETVEILVDPHTVSFDVNGHGTDKIDDQKVRDWEKASVPDEPEGDTGDSFQGWFTDPECTEKYDFNEPVTEDIKLYAGWASIGPTPLACLVEFDMNGHGTQVDAETVAEGDTAVEPDPAPTESGWTFGGWYKDQECTDAWNFNKEIVRGNTTLYAKWIQDEEPSVDGPFTVSFIMNGHGSQVAAQSVKKDQTAKKPADPTDNEWTFVNWYTDKECTAEFDFGTAITADTTLYAKWTAKTPQYDVVFVGNYNGSTYTEYVQQTVGEKYVFPTKDPEREGFVFAGWYTASDIGDKVTTDTTVSKAATHTLYAHWKSTSPATCNPPKPIEDLVYTGEPQKIAYAGNAKGGKMQYVVLKENETIQGTIPWSDTIEQPTDAGKYYVYYYVDGDDYHTDYGRSDTFDDKYRIEAVIAKAEPPYTAPQPKENLVANGNPQELVTAGSTVTGTVIKYAVTAKADDPVADNEWSTAIPKAKDAGTYYVHYFVDLIKDDPNSHNYVSTNPGVIEVSILPAGTEFTVTYNMNGHGAQIDPQKVKPGEKVTKPADPTVAKLKFKGWFAEPECASAWNFDNDTVSGNMTLYAGWEPKYAKVTRPPINDEEPVYDGDPFDLADEGTAEGGTMKYAVTDSPGAPDKSAFKDTIDPKINAGIYYIYYYAAGDDDHLDSAISYIDVELRKRDIPEVKAPKAIEGLIEDGTDQELVTPGKCDYGTLYYALSETNSAPETGWTTEIPEAKKAGDYYVFYYAKGNENHNDSKVKSVKVTIESKAYDVWVDGVRVTSANADNVLGDADATVKYDPKTKTLTLNNAALSEGHEDGENDTSCIYTENGSVTSIVLKGDNRISSESANCGIKCDEDLEISGSGSLNITIDNDTTEISIGIDCRGYLKNSSTLEVTAENPEGSVAVSGQDGLENTGKITATTSDSTVGTMAIVCNNELKNSGVIVAKSGKTDGTSVAVTCDGDITNSGTITATADQSETAIGIQVGDEHNPNCKLNNTGTITASSDGNNSYGLVVFSDINNKSTIYATGKDLGIAAFGNINNASQLCVGGSEEHNHSKNDLDAAQIVKGQLEGQDANIVMVGSDVALTAYLGPHIDENEDEKCDICGKTLSNGGEDPDVDDPTGTGTDTGDDNNALPYGIAMLIALAGIGITGRLKRR